MAHLKVFAVWDNAVGAYVTPHCIETRGLAVRGFIDVANSNDSQIAKHPKDFSLFELGEYDQELGSFTNHPAPVNLGSAASFLSKTIALSGSPEVRDMDPEAIKARVRKAVENSTSRAN